MKATQRTPVFLAMAAAVVSTALLALPAIAQSVNTTDLSKSTNKKQAVDIESNAMEIIDEKNQAIFTGKVVAKRGKVTLSAEKLVVDFVKEKQNDGTDKTSVTFLNATGGVLIITSTQRITGQWARMDVKADKAVVGGNVVVKQGSSIIRGKKLKVNLKTDRSEMTGGRVRGTFTPN
ncbi:hypothetical protein MNBD_ALPHA08-1146 [hydrothermal vent metagenome]|uniref:Organic solvent tolerance-like N-terminal domain-containing protein n=1 Tax=hydrothermal vent metagenome TaxID=652676 RepID=A0A3B0SCU9_9ZZZZ